MQPHNVLEKIANPINFYQSPMEVDKDKGLSINEKITLLTNWLDDNLLRQIAEEENMSSSLDSNDYSAEILSLLHKYKLEKLGQKSHRHH